jgi:hypothetical protein
MVGSGMLEIPLVSGEEYRIESIPRPRAELGEEVTGNST